jgi:L-threonylcarbamoyladenylate synthase
MTNSFQIKQAAKLLFNGGVIAYPTEGVYGLGCLPDDSAAVERILDIKRRSMSAGLILVAPDYELLSEWIAPTDAELHHVLEARDKVITWVVTAHATTPDWLTGGRSTLAVRMSAHPVIADLCYATNSALVSTSANRTGHRAAKTALQSRYWLGNQLDYVISGGLGNAAGASEIRMAHDGKVIRPEMTTNQR